MPPVARRRDRLFSTVSLAVNRGLDQDVGRNSLTRDRSLTRRLRLGWSGSLADMDNTTRGLWAVCSLTLAVPALSAPIRQSTQRAEFTPPACTEMFPDVPQSDAFCGWIEQFATDEIATSCGGGNYCPDQPVTRRQVAMLIERAMRGTSTWNVNADTLDGLDSAEFVTTSSFNWAALRRRFYLTNNDAFFDGSQALGACAAGFHMASMFEILDVSGLVYDSTLGITSDDSGNGPPSAHGGWARNGYFSASSNCSAWTSTTGNGNRASLMSTFGQFNNDDGNNELVPQMSPWVATNEACANASRVWCVED